MTPTEPAELTTEDLDAVAWRFLRSEFASQIYADWPIDRRIEAYLLHHEASEILRDGSSYSVLLERVMANIGPALRNGVLPQPASWESP
ncbi:MAG: hypothetical protein ACXWZR_16405 [Mycobacterium sp.]